MLIKASNTKAPINLDNPKNPHEKPKLSQNHLEFEYKKGRKEDPTRISKEQTHLEPKSKILPLQRTNAPDSSNPLSEFNLTSKPTRQFHRFLRLETSIPSASPSRKAELQGYN